MFERFFDTAEAFEYADWVLIEVKRALPPGFDPNVKNLHQRADRLNELIGKRTDNFVKKAQLNIYKKAKLAARIREGMHAQGYPESFVKAFSIDLVKRIQFGSKRLKKA